MCFGQILNRHLAPSLLSLVTVGGTGLVVHLLGFATIHQQLLLLGAGLLAFAGLAVTFKRKELKRINVLVKNCNTPAAL